MHGVDRNETVIAKQWAAFAKSNKITVNPIHIMMNVIALIIFPFVGSPIIRSRTGLSMDQFNALMEERKKLIPIWVNAMILSK